MGSSPISSSRINGIRSAPPTQITAGREERRNGEDACFGTRVRTAERALQKGEVVTATARFTISQRPE